MSNIFYEVFCNPKKQWVAKIDIVLLGLWAASSYMWGLPHQIASVYLLMVAVVIATFQLIVAELIPKCGFWYHHG